MSKGTVNKAIIIGRLGADPELRYTPSGQAVTSFNMATNEAWRDAAGATQERTEWHSIVVWGKLAETCAEYLKKGSHVYIEGRLQTRSWDDQNGVKRYKTEIVAQRMQMLDSKGAGMPQDTGEVAPTTPGGEPVVGPPIAEEEDDLPF